MRELIQRCLKSLVQLFEMGVLINTEECKRVLAIKYPLCFCANCLVQEHDFEVDR